MDKGRHKLCHMTPAQVLNATRNALTGSQRAYFDRGWAKIVGYFSCAKERDEVVGPSQCPCDGVFISKVTLAKGNGTRSVRYYSVRDVHAEGGMFHYVASELSRKEICWASWEYTAAKDAEKMDRTILFHCHRIERATGLEILRDGDDDDHESED